MREKKIYIFFWLEIEFSPTVRCRRKASKEKKPITKYKISAHLVCELAFLRIFIDYFYK